MHCLYCGKPIGFLKELTDGEFCSGAHRQRYKKLTKMALARLLDNQPEGKLEEPPPQAAPAAARPRQPLWGSAARKKADLGKLFRPDPHASQIPAQIRNPEQIAAPAPVPSVPGFQHSRLAPALGNAAVVWSRLEPAPPAHPGISFKVSLDPSDAPRLTPRVACLSGLLRQQGAPALRAAELLPPLPVSSQSPRPSVVPDGLTTRSVPEFAPIVALPSLSSEVGRPSLCLAQPIQLSPAVAASLAPQPVLEPAGVPVAFRTETVWRESASLLLQTIDFPAAAVGEEVMQAPAAVTIPALPAVVAAAPASVPLLSAEWRPWSDLACIPSLRQVAGYRYRLFTAGFKIEQVAAYAIASRPAPALTAMFAATRPVLPSLATSSVLEPAAAELQAIRLRAADEQKVAAAEGLPLAPPAIVFPKVSVPSPASFLAPAAACAVPVHAAELKFDATPAPLPAALRPVLPALAANRAVALPAASHSAIMPRPVTLPAGLMAEPAPMLSVARASLPALDPVVRTALPAAGLVPIQPAVPVYAVAMMREVAALAPAPDLPRLPVLRAVPVREVLRTEGTVREEVPAVAFASAPLPEAAGATSGSMLPSLATLFRYSKAGKGLRPSAVVFEGARPRDIASSRLTFRELPMPAQHPRMPAANALRIVETFHYLRPLEKREIEPIQALLMFWRSIPAYVRFAAAAACLLILLWVTAPSGRVSDMVASRWTVVQQGIQSRAAVELAEDFRAGMPDWQGAANKWERSWAYDKAGFVRPGKLALYAPSMKMQDYRVEFLVQVDRKSVSWVYRAADHLNYYATKLTILKPGPLPSMALIRYPVIGGMEGPRVEVPIRLYMHNNTPYRVQLTVQGSDFVTSIEGQIVDFWRDDKLQMGGFGFFSDTGERARVYWMKMAHQDDFIGRVCAYFYENPIHRRRSGGIYQ